MKVFRISQLYYLIDTKKECLKLLTFYNAQNLKRYIRIKICRYNPLHQN